MNIGIADTSGQLDHARVAELLARRWTENRRHFITIGTIDEAGFRRAATRTRPYLVPALVVTGGTRLMSVMQYVQAQQTSQQRLLA